MSIRLAIAALLALLAGTDAKADRTNREVRVEVVRNGNGYTATFDLPQSASAWAFARSALARRTKDSWRLRSWIVETPNVRLERRGDFDVFSVAHGNVPRKVRVRFTPFAQDLQADYDPALVFTDGTVALFTGHFAVGPWRETGDRLDDSSPKTKITFRDRGGKLLYKGLSYHSASTSDLETYVVFGSPQLLAGKDMSGIIDPQLPGWLRGEMVEFLPRSISLFRERLGAPGGSGKPTILISWAGPAAGMLSQGGSVLPNLLAVRLEGDRLLAPSPDNLAGLRWFIAHESAHFWLGQAVAYSQSEEAWITEGGANLLAYRLIEQIDANYQGGFELYKDWSDCVALAKDKPVATAGSRQEHRAYYACGTVFAMVAEGAAQRKGRDFFDFTRDLLKANRRETGGDGLITMEEWLAAVTRESGDPTIADDMRQMLTVGVSDPQELIGSMLRRVGRRGPGR